jgi:carbonic anhydrase
MLVSSLLIHFKAMRSIKHNYILLLILLVLQGITGCKSGNNEKENTSDTLAAAATDSTLENVSVKDTSGLTFEMVLDSVYQPSPVNALQALLKGHSRYARDSSFVYASDKAVPDSLSRLKPYLVLTDIDLNQSAEKIFDLRRSMFMQLSSPACLVDPKQIAVMEYAVRYSGTKVILVLASSNSRMIGAACDNVQTDNFKSITNELSQAMKTAQEFADRSSANKDFVNNVAQNQAGFTLEKIMQSSPHIKMLSDSGKIIVKRAFYDANKRSVTMLEREIAITPAPKK